MDDTISELEAMIEEMSSELNSIVSESASSSSIQPLAPQSVYVPTVNTIEKGVAIQDMKVPQEDVVPVLGGERSAIAVASTTAAAPESEGGGATLSHTSKYDLQDDEDDADDIDIPVHGNGDTGLEVYTVNDLSQELNNREYDGRSVLESSLFESPVDDGLVSSSSIGVDRFLMDVERLNELYSDETFNPTHEKVGDADVAVAYGYTGTAEEDIETINLDDDGGHDGSHHHSVAVAHSVHTKKLLELASIINMGNSPAGKGAGGTAASSSASRPGLLSRVIPQSDILQADEHGNYFAAVDSESECDRDDDEDGDNESSSPNRSSRGTPLSMRPGGGSASMSYDDIRRNVFGSPPTSSRSSAPNSARQQQRLVHQQHHSTSANTALNTLNSNRGGPLQTTAGTGIGITISSSSSSPSSLSASQARAAAAAMAAPAVVNESEETDQTSTSSGAPTSTWNSWLGATGMKAAGVGLGIASAGWQATRTSIAKVSEVTTKAVQATVAGAGAGADNTERLEVYNNFAREKGAVEIVVNAGSVTQIPFILPKGKAILWRVMVKYLDIHFGVKLRVQEMGGAVELQLEAARKIVAVTVRHHHNHTHTTHTQAATAPAADDDGESSSLTPRSDPCAPRPLPPVGDGENVSLIGGRHAMHDEERHLALVFDNSYSNMRPKTVLYRVQIGSAEDIAALRERYLSEDEAVLRREEEHRQNIEIEKASEREKDKTRVQDSKDKAEANPEDAQEYDFIIEDLGDKYGYPEDAHPSSSSSTGGSSSSSSRSSGGATLSGGEAPKLLVKNLMNLAGVTTGIILKTAQEAGKQLQEVAAVAAAGAQARLQQAATATATAATTSTNSSRDSNDHVEANEEDAEEDLFFGEGENVLPQGGGGIGSSSNGHKAICSGGIIKADDRRHQMLRRKSRSFKEMCEEHEQLYQQDVTAGSTSSSSGVHTDHSTSSSGGSSATSESTKKLLLPPPLLPATTSISPIYAASYGLLATSLAGAASVAPYQRMQFDTRATVDPDAFNSLWTAIQESAVFQLLVIPTEEFSTELPYSLATLLRVCGTYMIAVGEAERPTPASHLGLGIMGGTQDTQKGVKVFSYTEGTPSSNTLPRRHIGPVRFLLETVLFPADTTATSPAAYADSDNYHRSDIDSSSQASGWQLQLHVKTSDPEYLSEFIGLLNFGATFQLGRSCTSADEAQLFRLLGLGLLIEEPPAPSYNRGSTPGVQEAAGISQFDGEGGEEEEERFV